MYDSGDNPDFAATNRLSNGKASNILTFEPKYRCGISVAFANRYFAIEFRDIEATP